MKEGMLSVSRLAPLGLLSKMFPNMSLLNPKKGKCSGLGF